MSWLTRIRCAPAWAAAKAAPAEAVALGPAAVLALAAVLAPAVAGASRARLMAAGIDTAAVPADRARVTDRSGCMGGSPSGGVGKDDSTEQPIISCRRRGSTEPARGRGSRHSAFVVATPPRGRGGTELAPGPDVTTGAAAP